MKTSNQPATKQDLHDLEKRMASKQDLLDSEKRQKEWTETIIEEKLDDRLEKHDILLVQQLEHNRNLINNDVKQLLDQQLKEIDQRQERREQRQTAEIVRQNNVMLENTREDYKEIASDQLVNLEEKTTDHEERIGILEKQTGVRV